VTSLLQRLPSRPRAAGWRVEAAVEGRVEGVVDGCVLGWAWAPGAPRERIWVSVFVDDEPVGLVVADLKRADLLAAGIGDGAHGFSVALPASLSDDGRRSLRVMAGGANTRLPRASNFVGLESVAAHGASPRTTTAQASTTAAPTPGPTIAVTPTPVTDPQPSRDVPPTLASAPRPTPAAPLRAALNDERLRRHGPEVALGVGLLANLIVLLVASRHLGFFEDDFQFILQRRGFSVHTFLAPMNGHMSLVPIAIFKALFAIVGIGHSWPYRLVCVALDSACVVLLYLLFAPRAGRAIALLPAALLLALGAGTGATDLIWVTEIGFLGALAAGAGALLCLQRGGRRGDRTAAGLLTLSLASSSPGLAMCAGAAALLAWSRSPRRRWWVVAAPLALYGVWYLGYGTQGLELSNLNRAPSYMVEIAGSALGALAGLSSSRLQAGIALLAVLLTALVARRGARLPPLAAAGMTAAFTFWLLVALTRAQNHNAVNSRYLYPSAVCILIGAGALLSWRRTTPAGAALAAGALALVLVGDLGVMGRTVARRAAVDEQVRVVLGASELLGPAGRPSFAPKPPFLPFLTLGSYLAAVRQLGSPAAGPAQIEAAPPADRQLADRTLLTGEQLGLERPPPLAGASAPTPLAHAGVLLAPVSDTGARCLRATPTATTGAWIEVAVPPGRSLYVSLGGSGSLAVYVRRFAAAYQPQPTGVLPAGYGPRGFGFPIDSSRLPWHVLLVPTATLSTCLSP
jgi:hypothetical protein